MAVGDVYASIAKVMAVTWVYCLYLNLDWLWTLGTLAGAKYRFQGDAFCLVGTSIWHGNLSAAHRRAGNVVEAAGDGAYFIRIGIG